VYKGKTVCAVVAAGGSGLRFSSGLPKQFLPLLGKPIIAWSAELMQLNDFVDFAVMVINGEYIGMWEDIKKKYSLTKFIQTIPGGNERQTSVYQGIKHCISIVNDPDAIIAIHDGVRPLASLESLNGAIKAADEHGGAVVSVPTFDTVKCTKEGFITGTPDRAALYMAQTPQVFKLGLLNKAYENAETNGFIGSDDSTLVERLNGKVRVVIGSHKNIKITLPDDLTVAETYVGTNI